MFLDLPSEFDGPQVTDDLITSAERCLGFRLPESYISLLRQKNGGVMVGCHVKVAETTFYGGSTLPIFGIMGIGGEWSVDTVPELPDGNPEANFPIGISKLKSLGYSGRGFVFSRCGHSVYVMDYSSVANRSEPQIIYVD